MYVKNSIKEKRKDSEIRKKKGKISIQSLLISDIYVILAINNEEERMSDFFLREMDFKLAGAILMDLRILEKIHIHNEMIRVVDPKPIGDLFLDHAFNEIKSYQNPKKLEKLIYTLPTTQLFKLLVERLDSYRIIEYSEKRGQFKNELFIKNLREDVSNEIQQELYNILLYNHTPDKKYYYLISFLRIDSMYRDLINRSFFERVDQKKVSKRIKSINSNETIGAKVQNAIISKTGKE